MQSSAIPQQLLHGAPFITNRIREQHLGIRQNKKKNKTINDKKE